MKKCRSVFIVVILIVSICLQPIRPSAYASEISYAATNPNQEFGYGNSLIDKEAGLSASIAYPRTDLENVDASISGWINNLYESSKKELAFLRRISPRLTMEINTDYNSYHIGDRYAGIEIYGTKGLNTTGTDKSIVKTFNISIDGKRIISNNEILSNRYHDKVLALLREQIISSIGAQYSIQAKKLSSSCLNHILLTHKGVKVILEKGVYFPAELGTLSFVLEYDDLGEAFNLSRKYFTGVNPILPIDSSRPIVALTFDDGPGNATEKILDILEDHNARATFCVLGNRVALNSSTVLRAFKNGNEIIGHSWDHKELTRLNYAGITTQLVDTNNAIFKVTGQMPSLHRPPYGAINNNVKKASEDLNLAMVNWSIDPYDWKSKDAQSVYDEIMGSVTNGSIILCHDIHDSTGEAMEMVIPELIARGYQLITVSELLNYGENTVEPGMLYRQAENLSLSYIPEPVAENKPLISPIRFSGESH